jgi:hypothetical protein
MQLQYAEGATIVMAAVPPRKLKDHAVSRTRIPAFRLNGVRIASRIEVRPFRLELSREFNLARCFDGRTTTFQPPPLHIHFMPSAGQKTLETGSTEKGCRQN